MRVQVLHSGVVAMGLGFCIVWRWFNKVWLEQGVARKSWG